MLEVQRSLCLACLWIVLAQTQSHMCLPVAALIGSALEHTFLQVTEQGSWLRHKLVLLECWGDSERGPGLLLKRISHFIMISNLASSGETTAR